jgi:hypothetical protein
MRRDVNKQLWLSRVGENQLRHVRKGEVPAFLI